MEVRDIGWPRVRADILRTSTDPWSMVAIVETTSLLRVGQFELLDSALTEITVVMNVADSFLSKDMFY